MPATRPIDMQKLTFSEYLSATGVLKELSSLLLSTYEDPPKTSEANKMMNEKYHVISMEQLTNAKAENKALKRRLRELDAQEIKLKEELTEIKGE